MASPVAIQRSPIPSSSSSSSSPLQCLSTFKDRTTTATATPSSSSIITTFITTTSSPSPLDSFPSDPIFSAFLSPDFDSAARADNLQDDIHLLEKQLRSEVLSRHHDLLSQLNSVKDADSSLSTIRSAISTLQSSVRRVRSEIADPNRQIRVKTVHLSNLNATSELLQFTIHVLRLSKKLRDVMAAGDSGSLDLSKAAQLHCEILSLCNENEREEEGETI